MGISRFQFGSVANVANVANGPLAQMARAMWDPAHRPMGWRKVPGDAAIAGTLGDDPHPEAKEYPLQSLVLRKPSGKYFMSTSRYFDDSHLSEDEQNNLLHSMREDDPTKYNYADPHMEIGEYDSPEAAMTAAQQEQQRRHRLGL